MKTTLALSPLKRLWVGGCIALCAMAAASLGAQSAAPRITAEVISSEQATLQGTLHPLARPEFDAGRLPGETRLTGITLVFNRSAAQQADLDALMAAQQDPASPLYHQWLTPEQFGARFGMAQADLDKVQTWIEQQGFAVDSIARSRTFIRFSGSVRQAEQAFSTQMHYYSAQGERHISPSTELSLPAAIAPTVETIRNITDFRPKSQVILGRDLAARPSFTSSTSGSVYLAPGDVKKAYDANPLSTAGFTGAGQSITIVGQSAVALSDVEHFQTASGLTVKDPTVILVPGSGASTIYSGDETESDLDLEWSGAMAPGAQVNFVYTGDANTSNGVFDSITYAVDQKIGNLISVSYGACELTLNGFSLETSFQQAATQGQTLLVSSGDSGSTGCFQGTNVTNPPLATQEKLAVSYPASSPLVTAVGGTEITLANDAVGTYWAAASGADVLTSALSYIPEVAWNDDSSSCTAVDCLSSTGGGLSALFTKPTWQTGVPGIPADGFRDVPDISLYSSPSLPGYLYCSSDASVGITGSCSNGNFRDANNKYLTVAGGTSFAAPVFAGMLAVLNQKLGYNTGQGLINTELYKLASNAATYAAAFHDITTGDNTCLGPATQCTGPIGYTTNVGYDLVTGLGSIDLNALANAWPASTATTIGTTTSVSASNTAPVINTNVSFTIGVTSNTGSTVPTGAVTIIVDGGTPITGNALSASGAYVYTTQFAAAGNHQVIAQYVGDATHAVSTGVASVNVSTTSSGGGSFTLSASPLTLTQGGMGSSSVTVTPSGGYTGTVKFTVSSPVSLCYAATNGAVSGANPVTVTVTIDTALADCGLAAVQKGSGQVGIIGTHAAALPAPRPFASGLSIQQAAFSLAGLFIAGLLGWRRRQLRGLSCLIALAVLGLTLSACGGSSTKTTGSSYTPKGTYSVTITGADTTSATITSTATLNLTVQ